MFMAGGSAWLRSASGQRLHNMIEIVLWILLVVVLVYLANRLIERFTTNLKTENKRCGRNPCAPC